MRIHTMPVPRLSLLVPLLGLAVGCGNDTGTGPEPGPSENAAPTIGQIADQTVIRNTAMPRSVEVDLQIDDPDDDTFTITVASNDEGAIRDTTFSCGSGSCVLTVTPSPDATAIVTLDVTVEDGRGGQAGTSFDIDVLARLVTSTGDDGPGSLRTAVASADPGDVIGFDAGGAFGAAETIGLLNEIVLDEDLTIEGPGADRLTVSGNNAVRVFRVTGAADVTIRDLTMADGRAEIEEIALLDTVLFRAWGGAVFMDTGSKLTLSDCAVTGSVAISGQGAAGGAIVNVEGTLDIESCSIHDNSASTGGGGILNVGFLGTAVPAVTSLSDCTVSDNAATTTSATSNSGSGGGVLSIGGALIIDGSRIVRNTAAAGGGGIVNGFESSAVIRNGSEVSENSSLGTDGSGGGGGIVNDQGSMIIAGSTVEANSTARDGGGIKNGGTGATLTLQAGTAVLGNVAAELGGGIYNSDGGSVVLEAGTAVTGNTAGAAPPSGGGVYNLGALDGEGDVSGNDPDDVAP